MNTATWISLKSPIMNEIRLALKGKQEPGKSTPSRKESNRIWREEILGIKSEDQKKADKAKRQQRSRRQSCDMED